MHIVLRDGLVPSLRLLDMSHNHFTGETATAFGQAIVATKQGLTEVCTYAGHSHSLTHSLTQ